MKLILPVIIFSLTIYSETDSHILTKETWTGFLFRVGLGGSIDFEAGLKKDDSPYRNLPASPLLRHGIEYGFQFNKSFFLSGGLEWTITYPRNFEFRGKASSFTQPPISLWYVPMTNLQIGWAFNQRWLITIGLVYYWGLSNSLRYRCFNHLFIETNTIVWMDRIFKTGGFYGGGFDNFQWTTGMGFMF